MNNYYKLGDSYLLSLNLNFENDKPMLFLELFNPTERKEIHFKYDLKELEMEQVRGDEMATINNHPIMRVRNKPNGLNINIGAVLDTIEINNL